MKTTKKGFTLIELMVVIVIIGILAAIAIPKLFGMTAKAKAQEVGPAAGTWNKLQQAFIAEKGTAGSNAKIGYTLPGAETSTATTSTTANFSYSVSMTGTSATAGATAATDETSTGTVVWTATNPVALGGCPGAGASTWNAIVFVETGTATGVITSSKVDECFVLTPNFEKLK